jgi:hypothetical protein
MEIFFRGSGSPTIEILGSPVRFWVGHIGMKFLGFSSVWGFTATYFVFWFTRPILQLEIITIKNRQHHPITRIRFMDYRQVQEIRRALR